MMDEEEFVGADRYDEGRHEVSCICTRYNKRVYSTIKLVNVQINGKIHAVDELSVYMLVSLGLFPFVSSGRGQA
jgi:hypothetical protein